MIAALADVSLIGRAAMRGRIECHGLLMSGARGWEARVPHGMVRFSETPESLCDADLVIVAVKSAATAAAAKQIFDLAPRRALVVSFQNGMDNVSQLRSRLPYNVVLGAMVPFNVVQLPDGRLHRGTTGDIVVEDHPRWQPWLPIFRSAHLPLRVCSTFREIQWGKLIFNLNNAVNALSGKPLRTQLTDRGYRLVLAAVVEEALDALEVAGIQPAQLGDLPPERLPALLRLPNAEFAQQGGVMENIDARARSSMWEDLEAGRFTEVEELNGAVVRLALGQGREAPANAKLCALVHAAERGGERHIDARSLLDHLALHGPSLHA
ncbi:2-dehydropantoate 2-reductase [Variovorax sp. H27-G14]|uniref:2-dehydropantoate 2-reductase n=1 Tax=Variovorax sp. H27-G14 TaxID=3111914 RepID=UPI0038FBEA32